jgi:hypothetical protein
MEQVLAGMGKPFPALIGLNAAFSDHNSTPIPVFLDSFLAPRLQSLQLAGMSLSLPSLQKLLLSATDLVKIRIWNPPNSWYISPEEMVTCLSTLTRLEEFELGFQSRDNWES